jgi:hypothetical protein
MARTVAATTSDLDVMENAVKRMREVIYAKPYFSGLYDDALARVEADLGDGFRIMRGLNLDPEDVIRLGRLQIESLSRSKDVPQSSLPNEIA